MSMTRDEFKRAFTDAFSTEFSHIPTNEAEIEVVFSQEFLQKMEMLIALQQDGMWGFFSIIRRHIVVIAIIILGVTVSACGINQVITYLYDNVYEEMREEFYANVTATEITHVYEISEVPEGFEITEMKGNDRYKVSKFTDKRGNTIQFLQDATEEVKMHIQDERIEKMAMKIRDLDVVVFKNSALIGAVWIEDGYFMEILYYGCNEFDEVVEMIESIQ